MVEWRSISEADYHYNFAWEQGGKHIAILDDLDMVIIVITHTLVAQHGDGSWKHEKSNLNMVGDLIDFLPSE